jgi:hypothetical protein
MPVPVTTDSVIVSVVGLNVSVRCLIGVVPSLRSA